MNAKRKGRRDRGGFSLIELLLVLVILATLAAIVVPKFVGRAEQGDRTAAVTQIGIFESALRMFEVDCRRYPTEQEGLVALVEAPADLEERWKGPYLERQTVPNDPWGKPYVYRKPGTHNTAGFDLLSFGPDGQEGGNDDIDNWTTQ